MSNPTEPIAIETTASSFTTSKGHTMWKDIDDYVGPFRPGTGPRRDPAGEFPTGPGIGELLPDVIAPAHDGTVVDVHRARAGRPAAVVFFRSAVW